MTSPDMPRPDATSDENEYTLSIDDAADRYAHAGHPRTSRSIQRYCARGDLDCRKIETTFGSRYLIAAYSVARHIAQIEEVTRATGRVEPRPVADTVAQISERDTAVEPSTAGNERPEESRSDLSPGNDKADSDHTDVLDLSRQDATVSRYVEQLERDNDFLRDQIVVKDIQIGELTERAKETNHLIGGLQKMLTPLLGSGRSNDPFSGDNSSVRDV